MEETMRYHVYCSSLILVIAVCCLIPPRMGAALPPVNIGIAIDGPWDRNDEIRELFQNEILELTRGEFDVRFAEGKRLEADWTVAGVKNVIDRLLSDPEVDLILALGVLASDNVCRRGDLPKPVIAPFVIDHDLQAILLKNGASGVKNLNYVSSPKRMKTEMETFLSIVPFRKVAVLLSKPYYESIEAPRQKIPEIMKELNVDFVTLPVGRTIEEVFESLPTDVEAVYIAPLAHLPSTAFDTLVARLIELKLPSFSLMGSSDVERGILAALQVDMFPKIARRVALNTQRILLGEEPGSIPVAFAPRSRLTINMATARAIGVSPPWAVLTEAEVIQAEREEVERQLDLYSTVQEAVAANLDLAVQDRTVAAGIQDIKEARSTLLPHIDLSGLGVMIDEDRAEASFGQQAERTVSGSVTATQVLFSEPAWANLSIQKHVQKTREERLRQLRLDIAEAAATAYLNVLRAETFERIQKENLKRTRSNLEVARVRETVGTAGPAEVFRWESEIATNRKTVIEANAQRNLAEIELNRLLHRPAEEHFVVTETDLDDPAFISVEGRFFRYMGDPQSFKLLRTFMVEEGWRNAPELAALESAIAAQERLVTSTSNRFWSPTIALQGDVRHIFSKEGVGAESGIEIPGGFSFPEKDDTDWSVALNISFPLFEGGSKFSARTKTIEELARLRLERQAVEERIEQRIRSAMHLAGASYAGIQQARLSAEAAEKSLNVVEDAYSRGAVSIIDLLDAQNAALVANLTAANAVYDFLVDLMVVERAVGEFEFFLTPQERQSIIQRVQEYIEEKSVQ
jgi:outer membrane protein